MKIPVKNAEWPESWNVSFNYDSMEVFGNKSNKAYYYAYQNRFKSLLSAVEKYLRLNKTVIDLAAGSGNISLTLAEKGYRVIWNDLRSELEPYIRSKYEKGVILYRPGNIFELEVETADAVIISEIIEHVAHPDEFLIKVAGLVKKGGYVFLSTPLGDYFLNHLPRFTDFKNPEIFEENQFKPNADGHIFLLYLDELQALAARAGLKVIQIRLNNNPLTSGHLKLRYLLNWLPAGFVATLEKCTVKFPGMFARKVHSNVVMVLQKEEI
jgi:2-polyprenyl-6-hydroxyphenyl methylase/3-demethylubiquinone-9 3-methyltransferase